MFITADFEKNGEKLRKIAEENPKYKDVLLQKAEAMEKTRDLVANKESFVKLLDQVDETLSAVESELTSHTGTFLPNCSLFYFFEEMF